MGDHKMLALMFEIAFEKLKFVEKAGICPVK